MPFNDDILVRHSETDFSLKEFLAALVEPLQTKTDELNDFETEYKKRAKFNGRKIVLQEALNDIFGVTSAPFIIVETNQDIGSHLYFYQAAEISPVYFSLITENDPVYIFQSVELPLGTEYDFKIMIPVGIYTTELDRRVKAEANLYKLAGTRFITETY